MGELFDKIRQSVLANRYVVGQHEWQVIDGMRDAKLVRERPHDLPNPVVETLQLLAYGTEVKVVWSYIVALDIAKLVTVHFIDG